MKGNSLRLARRRLGLTQTMLGDMMGVSQVTIHRWESGVDAPRPQHEQSLITLLFAFDKAKVNSDSTLIEVIEKLPTRTVAFRLNGEVVAASQAEKNYWKNIGHDINTVGMLIEKIDQTGFDWERLAAQLHSAQTFAQIATRSVAFENYRAIGTLSSLFLTGEIILLYTFRTWQPEFQLNPPALKVLSIGEEAVPKGSELWNPSKLFEYIDEHPDPIYLYNWDDRRITMISKGWRESEYDLGDARLGMETLLDTLITKPFEQHLQEGGVLKALGGSWVKPGFEFNDDLIGLYLKDKGFQIMVHCLPEWRPIKKKSHETMRIVLSA